ncbi:MAG: hypothetical protein IH913_12160 [Proteobacteria bacterium]|nr:hypothetical protein [Pseudomonadota bacterium]
MQEKLKRQVLDSFLVVMRPIVRILLRYGIGYREFLEVLKTAYVDIASVDFGIRGRPTNISRIAVMTGLTRKEVRRLRNKIADGSIRVSVKTTPLADVLHHWHAQDEFTNSSGRPKTIPFAGDSGSFSRLVKRFGGDIPAGAMRTELKRVGAVRENDDGSLTVQDRSFQASEDHDKLITTLIHAVYPVLANTVHNTDPDRPDATWANKVIHTRLVRAGESGRLRRITEDRIVAFAKSMDDIFMAYESIQSDDEKVDSENNALAVGVFYFEERDKGAKYDW